MNKTESEDIKQNIVKSLDDLATDIAGTHKVAKIDRGVDQDLVEADWKFLQENGYVMIKNLITPQDCETIRDNLAPLLTHTGRNLFEGVKTQRLYSLLAKTRSCDELIMHPRIMALLDRVLLPNYLLSQIQAINILPDEKAQFLHTDDGFYNQPRPRPAFSAATIWAIDEFTAENGATNLIPTSQAWGDRRPTPEDKIIPAAMPQGSVIFYPGTLWHCGGANTSSSSRLALTAQYCQPYLRQQENYSLSTSKEIAKTLAPELQSMIGYSVHPPYIGSVDGVHPLRLLED